MVWENNEFWMGYLYGEWVAQVLLVLNAVKTFKKTCKNELN